MRRALIMQQRAWANDKTFDRHGYLGSWQENLCAPMSASCLAAFSAGSGAELLDQPDRPAKMRALHSSSALAVNVFDYWSERERDPLAAAFGLPRIDELQFEKRLTTGVSSNPAHLDIALRVGEQLIGIESKFTEWQTRQPRNGLPFKRPYFEDDARHWENAGLAACQQLAFDVRHPDRTFQHLNAPQLLKHALALAHESRKIGQPPTLWYLYFDCAGDIAEIHRSELRQFNDCVGDEISFRSMSYQQLFIELQRNASVIDAPYLEYLRQRYFPNVQFQ